MSSRIQSQSSPKQAGEEAAHPFCILSCCFAPQVSPRKFEISFDKLKLNLVAQKGRGIGERGKHNAAVFWDDWHELDEESLDLLDIDRLIPDW